MIRFAQEYRFALFNHYHFGTPGTLHIYI
jgi:hypothetical protein